jgi:hypothetical protein
MLNDTMILGIVLTIVISAVSIYLYSYVSYLEKKFGMIETMVVDLRMAMDAIMTDGFNSDRAPVPIAPSGPSAMPPSGVPPSGPAPAPSAEDTDETFYSSVLAQAHESSPTEETPAEGISVEEALKGLSEESPAPVEGQAGLPAPLAGGAAAAAEPATAGVGPNYDAMTRAELAAEAERRGLRVKRSMNRNEVLSLLRRATPTQVQSEPTGAENASGLFPDAEQLDSGSSVDIGSV